MNIRRRLFEYILDNRDRWDYLPGRSELRKVFSAWSDDIDLHLEQLEREGLLSLGKDGDDTVTIPPAFPYAREIGVQGLPAGRFCSDATSVPGFITLDLRGVGIVMEKDLFALLVDDDSMSDAGIKSNDIAILRTACPGRGDIVVVSVAGRFVLRRYVIVADVPHLLAENPLRPELLPAYEQTFHGVLWGVISTEPYRRNCQAAASRISYRASAMVPPEERLERNSASFLDDGQGHSGNELFSTVPAALRGRARKKITTSQRHGKKAYTDWPKPPSGTELNDTVASGYETATHKPCSGPAVWSLTALSAGTDWAAQEASLVPNVDLANDVGLAAGVR